MAEKKEAKAAEEKPGDVPGKKPPEEGENKTAAAHKLVIRYMWWSAGAGLIPIPVVDMATLAGVQLRMLHRLTKHYQADFSKEKGKSIIAALIGIITADGLRRGSFTSFIKSIPLLGAIGAISMPVYAGAITYAIGKVFVLHFESGGTLLDFDTDKIKNHFKKLYEEGKSAAAKLKPKKA